MRQRIKIETKEESDDSWCSNDDLKPLNDALVQIGEITRKTELLTLDDARAVLPADADVRHGRAVAHPDPRADAPADQPPAAELVVVALAVFAGAALNSLSGFGFALVTVPTMALVVGPKEAVVLSANFGPAALHGDEEW